MLLNAERSFRRIKGHRQMPLPVAALARHIEAGVMTTILKRAADRGEACSNITPRVVTLSTDLFRNELSAPAPRAKRRPHRDSR